MRILVTGATGFVGSRLVEKLRREDHAVSALVRDASRYDPPNRVEVIEADLLDPETLDDIFDRYEVVYYLVHSLRSGSDFVERDRKAAENFLAATTDAGVSRVIYLGGLGETGSDLSEHLRSRQQVETVLSRGDYELTSLRAAIIIGEGSASFVMLKQLANRLPIMITPRWVRTECQPIAIEDVLGYLVGILDVPQTAGETYEIGGPEILTYESMIRRTAAYFGKRPIIIPVPILSPQLSVYWVDLVTDIPKEIAHPLIHGLKNPVIVRDERIRELVPIDLTPFDTAIENALSQPAYDSAEEQPPTV